MNALVDFIINHGVLGLLVGLVVLAAAVAYRAWRDLVAERDFWRDTAVKALQAGEVLAERPQGSGE